MNKQNYLKRIITLFLSIIILLSTFLIHIPLEVSASNGIVTLSGNISKYGLSIPSLGYYPSTDNLWDIYADGKLVFCISPHKLFNNRDTYTYTTYNAVTFYEQSYAKALTYYHQVLGYSIMNKAQTQM